MEHRLFRNVGMKLPLKSEGIPRQAEVALGVPGRLRPRIFSIFGTTRVVGHQPNVPVAFTSGEIPGTHFQRLIRPQGTWFCRKELRKKSQVTSPGMDPGTVRLVAQRLNHYATPGPTKLPLDCVKTQKSVVLRYFAAEAWNHAFSVLIKMSHYVLQICYVYFIVLL
jgi:hypothetical protein